MRQSYLRACAFLASILLLMAVVFSALGGVCCAGAATEDSEVRHLDAKWCTANRWGNLIYGSIETDGWLGVFEGGKVRQLARVPGRVGDAVSISDDGRTLAGLSQTGQVEIWTPSLEIKRQYTIPAVTRKHFAEATLSPDGRMLAVGTLAGFIVTATDTGAHVGTFAYAEPTYPWKLEFSTDGAMVGCAPNSYSDTLIVWPLKGSERLKLWSPEPPKLDEVLLRAGMPKDKYDRQKVFGQVILNDIAFDKSGRFLACVGGSLGETKAIVFLVECTTGRVDTLWRSKSVNATAIAWASKDRFVVATRQRSDTPRPFGLLWFDVDLTTRQCSTASSADLGLEEQVRGMIPLRTAILLLSGREGYLLPVADQGK